MEKKTMSTPVANANNLSVHFIGEGNVPSVYVDGRILSPQTVVYIISVGGVRSVNNLPPRGMTYNRPNGSVVTVIDAIVQRLLLERPVVCNIGASWVVRSNSVVVSASAAAFEGFTEPPYRMRIPAPPGTRATSKPRICRCMASTSPLVGVLPVPIAQTGS